MDIRRMNLFDSDDVVVQSVTKEEYSLGPDRLAILERELPTLVEQEYWHPNFQAWSPFLNTYLQSGCNPELTLKYGGRILNKEDYLLPPESIYHRVFEEILLLRNTTGTVIFEDIAYNEIESLCATQCKFFIQGRKQIERQLHDPAIYAGTVEALLNIGTWRSFLCAMYLYRHSQTASQPLSSAVRDSMQEKLNAWWAVYSEAFEKVRHFVSANGDVYGWYCDLTKEVVHRVWRSAMALSDRELLLGPNDVYGTSIALSESLVAYVNSHPLVYDDPFKNVTVWDALCNLFYASDVKAPDFFEKSFYALCIPASYIKRVCDILYDFYWVVKDGRLTGALYDRKLTSYSLGDGLEQTPEDYLGSLYDRGYPLLRKE